MASLKYAQRLRRWADAGGVCVHEATPDEMSTIGWAEAVGWLRFVDGEPCCIVTDEGLLRIAKAVAEHKRHGTWRES
jgi:hypothetical protein